MIAKAKLVLRVAWGCAGLSGNGERNGKVDALHDEVVFADMMLIIMMSLGERIMLLV